MAQLKTQVNDNSVVDFLNSVENERRREDSFVVLDLMKDITQEEPKMWGTSIIGFGSYHYKYASGHEADWLLVGFSPRKQSLTLYIMDGFASYDELLDRLGKHKTGKSCLYINKLADVNLDVLREMISLSVAHMRDPENLATHAN